MANLLALSTFDILPNFVKFMGRLYGKLCVKRDTDESDSKAIVLPEQGAKGE